MTEDPEKPGMFFRANNLSSCQNKEGNREGERDRERVHVLMWACLKWNGKWAGRFECDRWWQHSSAALGHKTDLGNCYLLLPPWRSHFMALKIPLLLHGKVRQFTFNCPQQVKGKSHCFTLNWVNINTCSHTSAQWSVRPGPTQPLVTTLSPISAVHLLFVQKPTEQLPNIPNRKYLSWSCSWQQFPLQLPITYKHYNKGEHSWEHSLQTCSKLVKTVNAETLFPGIDNSTSLTLKISKKCQQSSLGWRKPSPCPHPTKAPGISVSSLVYTKDLEILSATQL